MYVKAVEYSAKPEKFYSDRHDFSQKQSGRLNTIIIDPADKDPAYCTDCYFVINFKDYKKQGMKFTFVLKEGDQDIQLLVNKPFRDYAIDKTPTDTPYN